MRRIIPNLYRVQIPRSARLVLLVCLAITLGTSRACCDYFKVNGTFERSQYGSDGNVNLSTTGNFQLAGKDSAYEINLTYPDGNATFGVLAESDGRSTYSASQIVKVRGVDESIFEQAQVIGRHEDGSVPHHLQDFQITQLLAIAYWVCKSPSKFINGDLLNDSLIPDFVVSDARINKTPVVTRVIRLTSGEIGEIQYWGISAENKERILNANSHNSYLLGSLQLLSVQSGMPCAFVFSRFDRKPAMPLPDYFQGLVADPSSKDLQAVRKDKGSLYDFYKTHVPWSARLMARYSYKGSVNLVNEPWPAPRSSYQKAATIKVTDYRGEGTPHISYTRKNENDGPYFDPSRIENGATVWSPQYFVFGGFLVSAMILGTAFFCHNKQIQINEHNNKTST